MLRSRWSSTVEPNGDEELVAFIGEVGDQRMDHFQPFPTRRRQGVLAAGRVSGAELPIEGLP